jgi:hypothetical protein
MEQAVQTETTVPEALAITQIAHPLATIWLARERKEKASYFYGGTRLIDPTASDSAVTDTLIRLMSGESATKNRLINRAIESGALDDMAAELPPGFLESRVGGARCIIRPHTPEIASRLSDPLHPDNTQTTATVLESIGGTLNEREPRIKLTPDFGRYAGLADVLHQYTPNVLGIRCERGGCGGKSSYSTTGVLAGAEQVMPRLGTPFPVTLIGSAGAMGEGVLEYFLRQQTGNLGACDLVYDEPGGETVPQGARHLPSRWGMFTDECLDRGGLIVATTVGDELENSDWERIPRGTGLLLAHNLALPAGEKGIALARALAGRGVLAIPGQALTLGGALTARVEWYWRQKPGNPDFNKPLAHKVVHRVVSYLVALLLEMSGAEGITPFEAMLRIADEDQVV